MWVGLDHDPRGLPVSAGSGIADNHKPVAVYPIEALLSAKANQSPHTDDETEEEAEQQKVQPATIAEVDGMGAAACSGDCRGQS